MNGFKVGLSEFSNLGGGVILIDGGLEFFLHSKFCIIDERIVITGSYNWSLNARSSIENIVVIDDSSIADKYSNEYKRIRDNKMHLVAERFLEQCTACEGKFFNARIYDLTNYSYYEKVFYDIKVCSCSPSEHLVIRKLGEEFAHFAEIFEHEYERLGDSQERINDEVLKSNVESAIATHFDSRSDLFSVNICADILMIGCIQGKLDGYDNDYESIELYWCHDLIKPFAETISDFEEDIINRLRSA